MRRKLFNVYFVRQADYRRAVRLVGVAEGTFDYWYREVKRAVGAEFARTGLFPPSAYFLKREDRTAAQPQRAPLLVGAKQSYEPNDQRADQPAQ